MSRSEGKDAATTSPSHSRSTNVYPPASRSSHLSIVSQNSAWFPLTLHHVFDLAAPPSPASVSSSLAEGQPEDVNGYFKIENGKVDVLLGLEGSREPGERVRVVMEAQKGSISVELLPRTRTSPRISLTLTGGFTNLRVLLPLDFRGPIHLPSDCHFVRLSPALSLRWTSRTIYVPEPRPMYFCDVMGFIGESGGWEPDGKHEQEGFDTLKLETHHGRVELGLSGEDWTGPRGEGAGGVVVYTHETWLQEEGGE